MPKVDDRSPSIEVGPEERDALATALAADEEVLAAYLFGSQARGEAGSLSDVDVAVWLRGVPSVSESHHRHLALIGAAASALKSDEVQVVVLNTAPPLLAHRVLRDGRLLVDRDPRARVRSETAVILEYLDTIPLRSELSRGLAHRMADGSYGRSRDS